MSSLPVDTLRSIFEYAGNWDADLALVCKEWNEVSLTSQWDKLCKEVSTRKEVNQDWWKEKIDAAHKCRLYSNSGKVFFRVLRSYVAEELSPYCTQLFRHTIERGNAFPSFYSLSDAGRVCRGEVSKKVAVWLSVEDILQVNKSYIGFARRLFRQVSYNALQKRVLGLDEKDYFLIPMMQYNRIEERFVPNEWIAPPISETEHYHAHMSIIRDVAPRFIPYVNRDINMLDPSDLELTSTESSLLNARFTLLLQHTQVSASDFRKWQKSQIRPPENLIRVRSNEVMQEIPEAPEED